MTLVSRPKDVAVPDTLNGQAADIWRSAFLSAYDGTCEDRDDRDACAAKIAWSAVKNKYSKNDEGEWVQKNLANVEGVYEFAQRIEQEFKQQFGNDWWMNDVLFRSGNVVVSHQEEARNYLVSYTVTGNGEVVFGDPPDWVEVDKYQIWEPVQGENTVQAQGYPESPERPVIRQDDGGDLRDAEPSDGQIPVAIEPDRPIIPTPQNLTQAEAEVWNRNYLEAIEGPCAQEDNPQSCAARKAWDAVNAFGEEADLEGEETVEPEPEPESEEAEGEVESEDEANEEELDDEEFGDEEAAEDEEPEDEEEPDAATADEDEAEDEEEPEGEEPEADEDEDAEASEEEGDEEVPALAEVMSKVAEGESLSEQETKVLSVAIDAAKKGETDDARINALDAIMEKVSAGQELSEDEQKFLSAALSAISEKSTVRLTGRDLSRLLLKRNKPQVQSNEEGREGAMTPEKMNGYTEREMKALVAAGRALPDGRLPIVKKGELTDALNAVYRGGVNDPEAIGHIIVRAGSLGALGMLPDDWINKGTALFLTRVSPEWVEETVERASETMDDRAWLERIGEDTKITRPGYISSHEWGSLPAVERTARAEYLRRFVKRMYEQAVSDMTENGWRAEPMTGREHEMQFKRWIEHEDGPLLQRAILVRKVGTTNWRPREMSRGASLSSAVMLGPDEVRP